MQERYDARKHLGVAVVCLLLAALGVVLMAYSGFDSPGAVVTAMLGGFFIAVAAIVAGGFIARRRGSAPEPSSVSLDGEPALFLPRAHLAAVGNCLLAGALALFFAGWAVVLGLSSGRAGAAVLAIPALVFAALPVFALTGRWVAGGLWLTPTRLVQRAYGVRAWTAWDDIVKVDAAPVDAAVDLKPVTGLHTRDAHGSYTTPFFRNGKVPQDGRMVLDLRDLAATSAQTVGLLSTYWEHPELRHELGGPAALSRVSRAIDRSGRT
jgi:hypothetical protein